MQSLMNILTATEAYLRAAHPKHYEALRDRGVFEISRSLSIFQATSIRLLYTVRHLRTGQDVSVQTQSGVFLSRTDNSLWVTRGVELFSTEVARQLSRLFHDTESQAFSFLDSMMQTRGDPDAVSLKLSAHGIDSAVSNEDEQAVEAIEILPDEDESGLPEPESSEAIDQRESGKPERKDVPTPPPDIKVSSWLINPDEYVEDEEEERIPYDKTEVKVQPAVKKRVKLGPGKHSDTRPERRLAFKVMLSKLSTEDVALELAMRHEEEEGNLPEDRHKQRRIGYDIYSKMPKGGQKFIEVKGFRDDNGVLNFPRHEWAKAENEQEDYFVYIYTGLRTDGSPALCVIQNPTKYLTPDTPEDKRVSDWWNGVAKKITFKRV